MVPVTPALVKELYTHCRGDAAWCSEEEFINRMCHYIRSGPSAILLHDTYGPIALLGMSVYGDVGYWYMAVSNKVDEVKLWFHREVASLINKCLKQYNITYVECIVVADNKRDGKYLETLGFEEFELLPKFNKDKDYMRYIKYAG